MFHIDMGDPIDKWEWRCPDEERHADWRPISSERIECVSCGETYRALINVRMEIRVRRDQIEIEHSGVSLLVRRGR